MAKKNSPRIEQGYVKRLWTPHGEGEIGFAYPLVRGISRKIADEYLSKGKRFAKDRELASLVSASFLYKDFFPNPQPENRDVLETIQALKNIRTVILNCWFDLNKVYTWTKEGVYAMEDPSAKGIQDTTSIEELEKILQGATDIGRGIRISADGRVGFAPRESCEIGDEINLVQNKKITEEKKKPSPFAKLYEYLFSNSTTEPTNEPSSENFTKEGYHKIVTPGYLANNGIMIITFGIEGAKDVSKLATRAQETKEEQEKRLELERNHNENLIAQAKFKKNPQIVLVQREEIEQSTSPKKTVGYWDGWTYEHLDFNFIAKTTNGFRAVVEETE